MIYLRTVTQNNYNECLERNRKEKRFVGDTCAVLADAYIYRETSLVYAIYKDDYRNKGYGEQVVKEIINHFVCKKAKAIRMQVHKSNEVAIHIYQKCGFYIKETSPWDNDFWIMEMILA